MTPRATYRLQLRREFGFDDAAAIVPYLAQLGVSHLYLSPVLQAAPNSDHGYDVVDHSQLNDELGGASAFARLSRAAASHDLSIVLDLVPNHMALAGAANRWWWDVLEDGPASRFANHFDIDWSLAPEAGGPSVLMPILGDQYGRVLEAGEFRLTREGGTFVVRYHDHELPLSPRSLRDLLRAAAARAKSDHLARLADDLERLPLASSDAPGAIAARHAGKLSFRYELRTLALADPAVAEAVDAELAAVSSDPDALDALLMRQNYRLAHWRTASDELDYRRFFDITSLVGLRVEDAKVFDDTHRLVLDLVETGDVDGLRIDHVDGLRDPKGYLDRLRAAAPDAWIVVEKILGAGERLPDAWPVDGTTGYEFARHANQLFVDTDGVAALVDHFRSWTGTDEAFDEVAREAQLAVMANELAAEVERVTELLVQVCNARRRHRDHTRRDLRDVVYAIAAELPVYRTYVVPGQPTSDTDRRRITSAVEAVRVRRPDLDGELLDLVERVLTLDERDEIADELAVRFQQLTAPVMAKGVEDTAFYRWVPLLALNEVGGEPAATGEGVQSFHAHNAAVARDHPHTMLALSTHDTKRSADVRARLSVLTEIPDQWTATVNRWRARNARHRLDWDDPSLELVLYQSLVGAWPIGTDRLLEVMSKSAKEAKQRTSWRASDPEFEAGLARFVGAVMSDDPFLNEVEVFLREHELVRRGQLVSLAQLALQLTSPGVPDTYQGDECWNFSLVDPDNRRPVDFGAGAERLAAAGAETEPKLWLVHALLHHRRAEPHRYDTVHYEALYASGPDAGAVVGFVRDGLATVVVRRTDIHDWAGTTVTLPRGEWVDVLVDGPAHEGEVAIASLLARFPVAVLERGDG